MGALAEIIRRHGPAYVQQFQDRMPPPHRRVLRDLARCRTPEAGGRLWHCPKCGQAHPACHSCGNRHCPTCGGDDARAWLDRQAALQLPVTYFLCTCTVPGELRRALAAMPRVLLSLFFQASASALMDVCRNPKWFGAMPGITGVLHTWTRAIAYHPHIHYLVTGGGLDSSGVWRQPDPGFLAPEAAIGRLLRARFRDGMRRLAPEAFAAVPASVWQADWVVHIKSVGDGGKALKYLARYLYRVALTDSAILHHDDTSVTFRYRKTETGKSARMTLPVFAFLHHFLQHVLPKGFVKIRYYGLHHPARRGALALARAALYLDRRQSIPPAPPPSAHKPQPRCPSCNTVLIPGLHFRPGQLPYSHAPP